MYSMNSCYTEQLLASGYYERLRQQIEQIYLQNSNTKVTLVAYNQGAPVSLYFLTRVVSQQWKDLYINYYITVSGLWSGSNLFNVLTPPPNNLFLGVPINGATGLELRNFRRTYPLLFSLLPRASLWGNTVLVRTPTSTYTANDYQRLFQDAGYPQGYNQFLEHANIVESPNVPTHCFYGVGFQTSRTLVYGAGGFTSQPTFEQEDGDSQLLRRSAEICLQWANGNYPFNGTALPNVRHFDVPSNPAVLQRIWDVVQVPIVPVTTDSGFRPLQFSYLLFFPLLFLFWIF